MTGYDEPPPTPSGRWDAPAEFDEFVRSRHAALLRFAHLLTGDPHAAADLVQEPWRRPACAGAGSVPAGGAVRYAIGQPSPATRPTRAR